MIFVDLNNSTLGGNQMNKKLLVGMFSAMMAMAPWSGFAAQTIDSPHVNVDSNGGTEDCTYCHFANYQPSDCVRCHANNAAPYGDGTAPLVTTHQNLDCQACHNPHVSLQTTGITGIFSGVIADTPSAGMTTLTGVSPTPDISWAEKTGPGRGLILWVTSGTESASFEINGIDATAGTVTVKGDVSAASIGNFDLRRGQLIAKKVTKTAASSYREGNLPVEFPSQGSTSIFIDTQHATPTGVCQVCHTATAYWKADGTGISHNANRACTDCHKHSSAFLVTGCTACHPGADPDGAPRSLAELASPSTGSATPGMHAIHATSTGYNFSCVTCHTGTGMDRINAPTNPIKDDGIQIGFNVASKYAGYLTSYNGQSSVTVPYVGTNHTTVTNNGSVGNGSLTCSNVYCHSNGKSTRLNCTTSLPNTSPAWDGSSADPQGDTVKCNNCHGYKKNVAGTMSSGRHDTHVNTYNLGCETCHADTVATDGAGGSVISNKTNHVNGTVDIKGSGTYANKAIVVTYDKTTRNCSVATCHPARAWTTSTTDTETCPDVCTTGDAGGPVKNYDPIVVFSDTTTPANPVPTFTALQVSRNTIRFTDTSFDPDRNDAAVANCRGGGHNGVNGQVRFSRSVPGQTNSGFKFDGSTVKFVDQVINDPSQYNTVDSPGQTVVYYQTVHFDNDLQSGSNLVLKTHKNPLLSPYDGYVNRAFVPIIWNTNFDDSQVNVLPTIIITPVVQQLGTGRYRLTLNASIIDPDALDMTKNVYMGGGHDGTTSASVVAYFGGITSTNHSALLNNTTGVGTVTPMTYEFTGMASGSQLWYNVQVFDAHRLNAAANAKSPTGVSEIGWQYVTAP
jgi:predicted CxxxxCH...CXXCH cytochrome family protein